MVLVVLIWNSHQRHFHAMSKPERETERERMILAQTSFALITRALGRIEVGLKKRADEKLRTADRFG